MSRPTLRLALVLLLCGVPLAGQPAFTGPEIRVAPYPGIYNSRQPQILAHPGGEVTAVWTDEHGQVLACHSDAGIHSMGPELSLGTGGYSGVHAAPLGSGFVVGGLREGTEDAPAHLLRIFDASGAPRGDSFPFDTPETPWVHEAPGVVSDTHGSFVVAWIGKDLRVSPYKEGIFVRRFNAAGVPQGAPRRLSSPGGGTPFIFSMTGTPDGESVVAWGVGGTGGGAGYGIVSQRVSRSGVPLGDPVLIGNGLGGYPSVPVAALTSDGGLLAAWIDDNDELWARRYDRRGQPRGERFRVDYAGGAEGEPILLPEADGSVIVLWEGRVSVHIRRLGVDGSLSPELSTGWIRPRVRPPVAATSLADGGFAVAWARLRRATNEELFDLAVQRFATDSSPGTLRFSQSRAAADESEGQIRVQVERADGTRGTVSAAYTVQPRSAGAGGRFRPLSGRVTFADGDSMPRLLTLSLLDDDLSRGDGTAVLALSGPTGGAVVGIPSRVRLEIRDDDTPSPFLSGAGETFAIQETDGWLWRATTSVIALSGGGFLVSWEVPQDPQPPWFENVLLGPDGTEVASSFWPSGRGASGRACAQPGGGFTLTCDGYTAGSYDPPQTSEPTGAAGQRFDGLGRPLGPELSLPAAPAALAAGRSGGILALSLEPEGDGRAALVTAYGRLGQPLGPPSRVSQTPVHGDPLDEGEAQAMLAADGERGGAVVWRSSLADGNHILARRIDVLGRPLGPEIAVAFRPGGLPDHPAVALLPGGGFVVAWEDDDGDGSGIFARRFDAAGASLGESFQVNGRTRGDQLFPRVAAGRDGRLLILWETPAGFGRPRIDAQAFDAAGGRLGSDFPVHPRPSGVFQRHASVAADTAGGFIVVWIEWAGNRPFSVLCRRLRAPAGS